MAKTPSKQSLFLSLPAGPPPAARRGARGGVCLGSLFSHQTCSPSGRVGCSPTNLLQSAKQSRKRLARRAGQNHGAIPKFHTLRPSPRGHRRAAEVAGPSHANVRRMARGTIVALKRDFGRSCRLLPVCAGKGGPSAARFGKERLPRNSTWNPPFSLAADRGTTSNWVAVGTPVARRPPHRSVREELPHTALTLGW